MNSVGMNINIPEFAMNYFNQLDNETKDAGTVKNSADSAEHIQKSGEASLFEQKFSLEVTQDTSGNKVLNVTIGAQEGTVLERATNMDEIKKLSYEEIRELATAIKDTISALKGSPLETSLDLLSSVFEEVVAQKSITELKRELADGKLSREEQIGKFNSMRSELQSLKKGETLSIKNNSSFYAEDLQNCMTLLAESLAESSMDRSLKQSAVCKVAALVSIETGMDIETSVECVANIFKYLGDSFDINVLADTLVLAASTKDLSERSQYIDFIFKGGYPHTTDIALAVKQSLCANEQEKMDIASLHTLTISRNVINQQFLAAKGVSSAEPPSNIRLQPYNFERIDKDGKPIVVIKQQVAKERIIGLDENKNEVMRDVSKDKGVKHKIVSIKNFDYHLAHIALLEAEALKKGLLDTELLSLMIDDINNINNITSQSDKEKSPMYEDLKNYLGFIDTPRNQIPNRRSDSPVDRLRAQISPEDMDDLRAKYAEKYLNEWGVALNQQQYVADVQQSAGNQTHKLIEKMNEANKFFGMGISSSSNRENIQKNVDDGAVGIQKHFSGSSASEALYKCSPNYVCRKILNDQLFNISGVSDPDKRLSDGTSTELQKKIVKNANEKLPNEKTIALRDKIFLEGVSKELKQVTDYKNEALNELKGCRRIFLRNLELMNEISKNSNEKIKVKAQLQEKKQILGEQETVWDSMSWVWPSQRTERAQMAELVFELERLEKQKAAFIEQIKNYSEKVNDPDEMGNLIKNNSYIHAAKDALVSIARQEQRIVAKLQDVDPQTMIAASKDQDKVVTENLRKDNSPEALDKKVAIILHAHMRYAKAVKFFSSQDYKNIKNAIKELEKQEKAFIKTEENFISGMKKMYGKEGMGFLTSAIQAAVTQQYLNSGEKFESHKVSLDAIEKQLKEWGIKGEGDFVKTFVELTVNKMTNDDGTLDKLKLIDIQKNIGLSDIAIASRVHVMWQEMANKGTLEPELVADEVKKQLQPQKILKQSLEDLMDDVIDEGGFSYDFSQGFFFSPKKMLGDEHSLPAPLTGLAWEINVQYLKTEGFHVRHKDDGSYEVLLTGGTAKMLSTSLEANLLGVSSAYVQAGVEKQDSVGVLLRFSEKENCLKFLQDIMNPETKTESGKKAKEAEVQSWMLASEIFNVSSNSTRLFSALSVSPIDFSPIEIPNVVVVSVISQHTFEQSVETSKTTESNANGTVTTTSHKTSAEFKSNALMLEVAAQPAGAEMPLFQAAVGSFDEPITMYTEKFITCTTPTNKLRADTAREVTIPKRGYKLMEMLSELGLSEDQKAAIVGNRTFYEKAVKNYESMGGEDTVTLKFRIKHDVLEKINQLGSLARVKDYQQNLSKQDTSQKPDGPTSKELREQIKTMLASPDSYEPESLTFNMEGAGVKHGFNNPLGGAGQEHVAFYLLGYMREHNFSTTSTMTLLLPQSEQKKLIPLQDAIYTSDAKFYIHEHIMRGAPEKEVKEAWGKALQAKTISEQDVKFLQASLDRYSKLREDKPNVHGNLEYQTWSAFTEKHPLGVSEAAVQKWLEHVSHAGIADAMNGLTIDDCESLHEEWVNDSTASSFMKPTLPVGSTLPKESGSLNKSFDAVLADMKPGDYHWIAAKSGQDATHAMGVYCDENNTICFFDPATGMYTGDSKGDIAKQMADCTKSWDTLTLYSGHIEVAGKS